MKILRYYFLISLVVVFSFCQRDLDLQPLTEAASENWFTDRSQVEMSLNALYQHKYWPMFKLCCLDALSFGRITTALDEFTDDWVNRTTLTPVTDGSLTGDYSNVRLFWILSYRAISRSNSILENIPRVKGEISQELYDQFIGDARFVRASQYSRLISLWGDVPYFTKDINIEESYTLSRTNKFEILQHIYDDFDYAIEKLPISYKSEEIKRATKGAALGIKARIALFFKDYEVARDAAKALIDLGVYDLYPDFGELFLSRTKNSSETVFGIPRSIALGTHQRGGAVTAYLSRNVRTPSATATPSWDLMCAFLDTEGKTIDVSSLYDPAEPFKNRDPRLAHTIVEFNSNYFGFNYTPHPDSATCYNYNTGTQVRNNDSKAGDQWASFNGLTLRKGIDETWSDNLMVENDKLILRYADVLLMYAESKIELNEIDNSVLDAMNQVRARAYQVNYSSNLFPRITTTNQSELRRILRIERRMEFAFEGLRHSDILRWRIAEVVMNYPNYGLPTSVEASRTYVQNGFWFFPGVPRIDENGCPDFTTIPNISNARVLSQKVFDPNKHYLWPIPNDDIMINPNLHQNPGY